MAPARRACWRAYSPRPRPVISHAPDRGGSSSAGTDGFTVFGEVVADGVTPPRSASLTGPADSRRRSMASRRRAWPSSRAALPVHAIDPSMHALVEGGPSERRRFLDWGVFHVEPRYLADWKRYRRVLGQRNAALKRGADDAELRVWSTALGGGGERDRRQPPALRRSAGTACRAIGAQSARAPPDAGVPPGWAADERFADAAGGDARPAIGRAVRRRSVRIVPTSC